MDSRALLTLLADGKTHSARALAERFGIPRAAVLEQIGQLAEWGLEVDAVPGAGLRLARPLDLIEADAVAAALAPRSARLVERLDVFGEIDSTNRYLLERPPSPERLAVCIAEYQRAGRGRRGRRWTSPYASGLCLSAGWRFAEAPRDLPALTLACGVAARRAIERRARVAVLLKWPNDLVWDGRKLGGILVELTREARGAVHAVVGIGVNVAVPPKVLAKIGDRPGGAADLSEATSGAPPRRAALAAALVDELAEILPRYAAVGFAPYAAEFAAADYLRGRPIGIEESGASTGGIARGIEADGALRVELDGGGFRCVVSGDVSVRLARPADAPGVTRLGTRAPRART
ncbi:MAG TPA: biotin--[acetyl-CoA-carboxylase] ligase [Gammaproteobacteria bacterium]|nr:biotin--[acetyl-CoA-carboxylase] ligase [Gammaproteobacteria bacterium]